MNLIPNLGSFVGNFNIPDVDGLLELFGVAGGSNPLSHVQLLAVVPANM